MAQLNQFRVVWSGPAGAPGVSTFYNVGSIAPFLARLKTFFEALKSDIPSAYTITYPGTGNVIESTTGQVAAGWSAVAPAPTSCLGSGAFARAQGIVYRWNTTLYTNGRNLKGRTFIVPVIGAEFTSGGSMTNTLAATFKATGDALCAGTDPMVIWSRRSGLYSNASNCTVPVQGAVLRSRRD